jgi:hypothetical protein
MIVDYLTRKGTACDPLHDFKVTVKGVKEDQELTYNWSVTAGEIVKGQGTPSITVDRKGYLKVIAVKVEISGIDPKCVNSANTVLPVCHPPPYK